jgi:hypothetical protein
MASDIAEVQAARRNVVTSYRPAALNERGIPTAAVVRPRASSQGAASVGAGAGLKPSPAVVVARTPKSITRAKAFMTACLLADDLIPGRIAVIATKWEPVVTAVGIKLD